MLKPHLGLSSIFPVITRHFLVKQERQHPSSLSVLFCFYFVHMILVVWRIVGRRLIWVETWRKGEIRGGSVARCLLLHSPMNWVWPSEIWRRNCRIISIGQWHEVPGSVKPQMDCMFSTISGSEHRHSSSKNRCPHVAHCSGSFLLLVSLWSPALLRIPDIHYLWSLSLTSILLVSSQWLLQLWLP